MFAFPIYSRHNRPSWREPQKTKGIILHRGTLPAPNFSAYHTAVFPAVAPRFATTKKSPASSVPLKRWPWGADAQARAT